nr:permease [Candidatus Omnitrophota bacterium]
MLQLIVDWFAYSLLKLNPQARWAQAVNFFMYDSIKIIVLLFILIFVVGVVRTYLPKQKVRQWMSRRGIAGNVFASFFGAITPFCSCSSIPLFFGFIEAGIPLGISFSFLITSPLINEYLVILMLGFFVWKITVLYVLSGLIIGILSGLIL